MPREEAQLLKLEDLCDIFNVSEGTMRKITKRQGFPRPVKVEGRLVRWRRVEVLSYLNLLPPTEDAGEDGADGEES